MSNFLIDVLTGRFSKSGNNAQQAGRASQYGSLAVVQTEPEFLELARGGKRFSAALNAVANAVVPVVDVPTTTAGIHLFNGEDKESLIIDSVAFFLASGTSGAGATLFVTVSNAKLAATQAANGTGFKTGSLSGSAKATRAYMVAAGTFLSTTAWVPVASNTQAAVATVGNGAVARVHGLVVPPGFAIGFAIVSDTGTTAKYGVGCTYSQLELDLE